MTRKDYELIADVLRQTRPADYVPDYTDPTSWNGSAHRWNLVMLSLADELGNTNPRFDKVRFVEACGGQR